ncbi:MAG: DUF805 domain-containing protein [Deltaproteobacteria bacterium]|jgi:uncharacterized membrane protein YhaH (DUF805 family)|nr:DUF805 domain-containing protein [Deltaproteobacteria bacterium]
MESFQRDFLDVITKKYALFQGRARRREYWMFYLWVTLVSMALGVVAAIFSAISGTLGLLIYGVIGLCLIALVVPSTALGVRRLHDIGQSGLLMLLHLTYLGFIPLIMALFDSKPGANNYGPNPKGL